MVQVHILFIRVLQSLYAVQCLYAAIDVGDK